MLQPFKAYLRPFYFTARKLVSGRLSLVELAYAKALYFSQFGEDVFLDQYFCGRQTGFYVDVGAFHPYNISNTCVFYRRGWHGINIEPNPASFRAFPKHRPRDINLNVAVGQQSGAVRFNCMEELSGIDDASHLFSNRRLFTKRCQVMVMPLATILSENVPDGTEIDFMSVDCEGHDAEVLHSNDWSRFRPEVVLVEEHGRGSLGIDAIMTAVGYQFARELGLTRAFVRQR